MPKKRESGKIITIVNRKGGIGKTSIAINLSAALAIKKKKVLLIDMDPQCDSTDAVTQISAKIDYSIYDLLTPENNEKPNIEDCILPTVHPNLYVLPNISESAGLEVPLTQLFPGSVLALRKVIRKYAIDNFDFTIIDSPPTESIFVYNGLYCADLALIPLSAGSSNSLKGVVSILELIEVAQETTNPDLKFLKIICNRFDRRYNAHQANIADAERRFGAENILKTTIPQAVEFQANETRKHETAFTRKPQSKGANAFRKVATELIKAIKDNSHA